jgi:hypothetical protein
MQALVAILIVVFAAAAALARKATHHRHKRDAAMNPTITKVDQGGTPRHPDDVALDRKIGSICRGC